MYRSILAVTLVASLACVPQAPAAADPVRAACPPAKLCVYPGDEFAGAAVVLDPPPAASGQCTLARDEFRSAVNNSKHFALVYGRTDCRIPPTPFAMCCSDGIGAGRDKDFGHPYRSVKWLRR